MGDTTSIILGAAMAMFLFMAAAMAGVDRPIFLPAPLTGAHERFGAGCPACHAPWTGAKEELCLSCHGRSLEDDTHRRERMAHPVKAKTPEELSGLGCVNCHREHTRPSAGGYTGPPGLCVMCHPQGDLDSRHKGLGNMSCQDGACHSYHSNFTAREITSAPAVRVKEAAELVGKPAPREAPPPGPEALEEMRDDYFYRENPIIAAQYEIGPHNGTKATCRRCHETARGFTDRTPPVSVCSECHDRQTRSFGEGRHGAPAALGVQRFVKKSARVGCGSCHDVHSLRMEETRSSACAACHGGPHVENYWKSGHYRYISDPVFRSKPMTGTDCAGCHMPRSLKLGGATEHNETLTGSSAKMMSTMICSGCHGLAFSLWSLYSPDVVEGAFAYSPSGPLPGGLAFALGVDGGGGGKR